VASPGQKVKRPFPFLSEGKGRRGKGQEKLERREEQRAKGVNPLIQQRKALKEKRKGAKGKNQGEGVD